MAGWAINRSESQALSEEDSHSAALNPLRWNVTLVQTWVAPTWTAFARDSWHRMTPVWLTRARQVNERYARRHGYGFCFVQQAADSRHGRLMQKVVIVRDLLRRSTHRDVMLFLDNDAIVFNFSVRVSELLTRRPAAPDFVMAGYPCEEQTAQQRRVRGRTRQLPPEVACGVNTGVYVVRGTRWALNMMTQWTALDGRRSAEGISRTAHDQDLLFHLIQHYRRLLPNLFQHSLFVSPELINTAGGCRRGGRECNVHAKFILHTYGTELKKRIGMVLDDVENGRLPRLLSSDATLAAHRKLDMAYLAWMLEDVANTLDCSTRGLCAHVGRPLLTMLRALLASAVFICCLRHCMRSRYKRNNSGHAVQMASAKNTWASSAVTTMEADLEGEQGCPLLRA